jgi:hypothetical protein
MSLTALSGILEMCNFSLFNIFLKIFADIHNLMA